MVELRTKKNHLKFSHGWYFLIGKIPAFYVYYDGLREKGAPDRYKLTCQLPGFKKEDAGYFNEVKAAKKAAGRIAMKWLKAAGLEVSKKNRGF